MNSALRITRLLKAMLFSFMDVAMKMRQADVQPLASSLAFATTISLVPLLAVSLSVFTLYGGLEQLMSKVEPFLLEHLVGGAGGNVAGAIRDSIRRIHSGALGVGGLIGLLAASTKLFHDMERAVHRVWNLRPTRSLLRRLFVYWLVMFFGPLLLAIMVGLISSRDLGLLQILPKGTISFLFVFGSLFSIYKFVPGTAVKTWIAAWSALVAAATVLLAQKFYMVVMVEMLRYNKVYGSLAAIPLFLLWILLLWWICLAGVALSCGLQKRLRT